MSQEQRIEAAAEVIEQMESSHPEWVIAAATLDAADRAVPVVPTSEMESCKRELADCSEQRMEWESTLGYLWKALNCGGIVDQTKPLVKQKPRWLVLEVMLGRIEALTDMAQAEHDRAQQATKITDEMMKRAVKAIAHHGDLLGKGREEIARAALAAAIQINDSTVCQ